MIVLDCSAAIAVVLETKEGKALAGLMEKDEKIISPHLYLAEIDSALSKYVKAGYFERELAHQLLGQSIDLVDEFTSLQDCCVEALDESLRNNHSSYDMFYLILARRNGATLFTLDRKLAHLAAQLKIDCVQSITAPTKK